MRLRTSVVFRGSLLATTGRRNESKSLDCHQKFLPLEIRGLNDLKPRDNRHIFSKEKPVTLHERFRDFIDWTNIWPAAATFHHSLVPFRVRQGSCKVSVHKI
ncbi:28S ribosomal protein S35, mitochondrial [Schistosoma haematobium]|uniref:28S ribosomal protein S35, mitochondrial n=1 Tax=Schistosoma haematobium TaxID=6185 RepID=A0A922IIP7_SCHHA|nr:28S ribosomal protein S35, mitochondrial [Schistosoma haematobium]KAH9580509.1 28S ribosomal protein S35, mitochondrial [Schistosoma haematobium]